VDVWLRRAVREPLTLSAALMGVINLAAVFGLLHLSNEQLGVLNVTLASVLGYVGRLLVTPVVRPRDRGGRPLAATQHGGSA
jgi:hypothetical protein